MDELGLQRYRVTRANLAAELGEQFVLKWRWARGQGRVGADHEPG